MAEKVSLNPTQCPFLGLGEGSGALNWFETWIDSFEDRKLKTALCSKSY